MVAARRHPRHGLSCRWGGRCQCCGQTEWHRLKELWSKITVLVRGSHLRAVGRAWRCLTSQISARRTLRVLASRGERGVSIHVPYRAEAFHTLVPFTVERERETLDRMAGGLLATLVKLARVGRRPGIRELTLRSVRTNRELSWRQIPEPVRCKMTGVSAIRRTGRLTDRDIGTNGSRPHNYL